MRPILCTASLLIFIFTTATASAQQLLIDAKMNIEGTWENRSFGRATIFENVEVDGVPVIRATGDNSASGLIRELTLDPYATPNVQWRWRVDQLQPSADIRDIAREDFGAVVFFIFGKPGFFFRNIRSLGYVWTNHTVEPNTVLRSVRRPKRSRYIVLRGNGEALANWVTERRNLIEDFRRAYGENPPKLISAISIWSDNDQTEEPVVSYFGSLKVTQ